MPSPEILEKGVPVRVRCAAGDMRDNIVWEDHGAVVMVCARDQFERLAAGYPAPMPIGFRREDVQPLAVARAAVPA